MTDAAALVLLAKSGVLDRTWYRMRYTDVAVSGADPMIHFLDSGWREGRDPSRLFSTRFYLAEHKDVADAGVNPLIHYLTQGWQQGYLPRAGFSPSKFSEALPDVCPLMVEALHQRELSLTLKTRTGKREDGPHSWPGVPDRVRDPAPEPPAALPLRTVAFYLPQFHPIPENDEWWGNGFTEWTNVRRGKPAFPGHHQPREPGDLGYYELPGRDGLSGLETLKRQVALAKSHGVTAFCFYTYWFGGKRLLESPLEAWLADSSLDMDFCLCWANENWTRSWDGKDRNILIGQAHSPQDDIEFIENAAPFLRDRRYLRVNGRPLVVVYRPELFPDAMATARRWRAWCRENGVGEIVLAYVQSFSHDDPKTFGFDFGIEFPPNGTSPTEITSTIAVERGFKGHIYDGRELANRSRYYLTPAYPTWRGICPSWDNEARRPGRGTVVANIDFATFRSWLVNAGRDTISRFPDSPSSRLVFINAWNEWAEGAHLEPDRRNGYEWLHAVREAQEELASIEAGTGPGVVVVAHDLQRNGAQMGALALAREIVALGRRAIVVSLGDGPLLPDFEDVTATIVVDDTDDAECAELARSLVAQGYTSALCNSSVTGFFARHLSDAGADVVGLVHELPGILASPPAGNRAQAMADAAGTLVFPSRLVRDDFPCRISGGASVLIRPQGRYKPATSPSQRAAAELREMLGIAAEARVVLAVGYADHRKGPDLLADAMRWLERDEQGAPVHVVWVGAVDHSDPRVTGALGDADPARLHLPGFMEDVSVFYAGADVLVIPSREDPYPSVALEGLEQGLPLVAFRGRTGLDGLVEKTFGVLVPETDSRALATGIREALDMDSLENSLVRRHVVREAYNYRKYVMDLLQLTRARIPRVSVVVPNYNYGEHIADRIRQIEQQDFPVYELIVLDDASTDGSVEEIKGVLDGMDTPAWQLVVNEANSGSGYRQWIKGASIATGDFIWIAEADDVAEPRFLSEVVPAFAAAPGTALSYCESRQIDEHGTVLAADYRSWTDFGQRDYTRRYVKNGIVEIAECLTVKNTIPNVSATVMRTDALRSALAEFDEVAEDLPTSADWWVYVQVLLRGDVAFSPHAMNSHRRHSRSVIARNLGEGHFREIVHMQRVARESVPLYSGSRGPAARFLRNVAKHLGVPPERADDAISGR